MSSEILSIALIAGGGALGGAARHAASLVIGRRDERLPWGTLAVNLSGCFALGALAAALRPGSPVPLAWLLLATGFLGAYTTVSAFALQTLTLALSGARAWTIAYVVASVVGALAATAAGFAAMSG